MKPVEQVKRVVELKPTICSACGALLLGEDADAVRHQVTELPRVEPDVIEYRKHTLTCLACGTPIAAEWPMEMPTGGFGPRAQATIRYFTGRMGMSQRDVEESMGAVFHTDVSLGSIPAQEERVSAALAEPVEEARITRVGELLREGATLTCDKTRRTCENLLDLEVALWTFVRVEGVEPTHNDTERRGRRAVLWRRRSFGTQSEEGSRFVEIS